MMMSMWWQNHSVSLTLCVAAGVATGIRLTRDRAVSLTSPASMRRAQDRVARLITVVAGH
jgi:hypothetical protein